MATESPSTSDDSIDSLTQPTCYDYESTIRLGFIHIVDYDGILKPYNRKDMMTMEEITQFDILSLKSLPFNCSTNHMDLTWRWYFYKSRINDKDFLSLGIILWDGEVEDRYWRKHLKIEMELIHDSAILESITLQRHVDFYQSSIGCPIFVELDKYKPIFDLPLKIWVKITLLDGDTVCDWKQPGVNDVQIMGPSTTVKLNSDLLAHHSGLFRTLKLLNQKEHKIETEEEFNNFIAMMDIIYHGSKSFTLEELKAVGNTANKYLCNYVHDRCEKFMMNYFCVE